MSPGVHGAPAQLHVSEAGEPGRAAARTQRAARPVPKSCKQKSVICRRVQVGHRKNIQPEILPASLASPYLLNLCLTRRLSLQRVVC